MNIREELIENLREMLNIALENGRNTTVTTRDKWIRVSGYLASCMNVLLNDVDLGQMAEDVKATKEYEKERLDRVRKQRKHRPMASRARKQEESRKSGDGSAEESSSLLP